MTLSIIIPVYNAEKYLEQTLSSAFSQKIDDFEIVCVNDGSSDNSASIIETFKENHDNLIYIYQENKGPAAARNTGINVASGEYIFFLDNDDTFCNSTNLQKTLKLSIETKSDLCVFNALINGEMPFLSAFPNSDIPVSGPDLIKLFFAQCRTIMIPIWGHLYKKEYLQKKGLLFNEDFLVEDILFSPIAQYSAQRAVCIDIPIVNYRWRRSNSITFNESIKKYIDKRDSARELYYWFSSHQAKEEEPYQIVFSTYNELLNALYGKDINIKKIIEPRDYHIMSQCYRSDYERKCYRLARISSSILTKYQNNTLLPIIRKIINRFL